MITRVIPFSSFTLSGLLYETGINANDTITHPCAQVNVVLKEERGIATLRSVLICPSPLTKTAELL